MENNMDMAVQKNGRFFIENQQPTDQKRAFSRKATYLLGESRLGRPVGCFYFKEGVMFNWQDIKFFFALFFVAIIFLIVALIAHAQIIQPADSNVYDAVEISEAIYKAEGGERAKKPFGILSVSCDGYEDCRNVCLNTIENNFTRWQLEGSRGDFLEYLASRYAPVGASNDPNNLNKNWLKNVRYFLKEENNG